MANQTPELLDGSGQTQEPGTVDSETASAEPSLADLQAQLAQAREEAELYKTKFGNSSREVQRMMQGQQQQPGGQNPMPQQQQPQIDFDVNTGFKPEEAQAAQALYQKINDDPFDNAARTQLENLREVARDRKTTLKVLQGVLATQQLNQQNQYYQQLEEAYRQVDTQNEAVQALAAQLYTNPVYNFANEPAHTNGAHGPFSKRAAIAAKQMIDQQTSTVKVAKNSAPDPLAGSGKGSGNKGEPNYYKLLTADERRMLDKSQVNATVALDPKVLAKKMFERLPDSEKTKRLG